MSPLELKVVSMIDCHREHVMKSVYARRQKVVPIDTPAETNYYAITAFSTCGLVKISGLVKINSSQPTRSTCKEIHFDIITLP
jgi:hypothetical protein